MSGAIGRDPIYNSHYNSNTNPCPIYFPSTSGTPQMYSSTVYYYPYSNPSTTDKHSYESSISSIESLEYPSSVYKASHNQQKNNFLAAQLNNNIKSKSVDLVKYL